MQALILLVALAVALLALTQAETSLSHHLMGFGAQRARRHGSKVSLPKNEVADNCGAVESYYYTDAIVDNFAPADKQVKWAGNGQRYWINRENWGGPGFPVFVFIGGEGAESCRRLTNYLYMYNLSIEHKALLVDVEHRFYGESYPTEDMSTENLKYLSSDQALADLARIIDFIKVKENTVSSKVITYGGSYPGNLSAWFRLKYPSVTQGSIASSAPVIAKVDFYEYMEVVASAINYFSGATCYNAFKTAAEQVTALYSQGFGSAGMKQLQRDFRTCGPMHTDLDLAVFLSDLMGNIQGTVQYNLESSGMTVTDICGIMTQSDDAYGNFVKLTLEYAKENGMPCEDANWKDLVSYIAAPQRDTSNSFRPWLYQTCNEFGYYQTTTSKDQPFSTWSPLNVDFSRQMCAAAFDGWKSDPQVEFVNVKYGDVRIAGTNIAFPSGTIDPWHALGVTNTTQLAQTSEDSIYILGTAHCNDLYGPKPTDPPSLTFAREVVADRVASWLK